ncbi:HD domain-containing protein [Candidatus Saccharibacteria bacterium]|nr:HD domain-containing protein [Candidatus Saccharibacteria bacterium]
MLVDVGQIQDKYRDLIEKAREYVLVIGDSDREHGWRHIEDNVWFLTELMEDVEEEFDAEVCVVAVYWHDVGRVDGGMEGHEGRSAEMLTEEMRQRGYDEGFIWRCAEAIRYHKWNMVPKTIEGRILRDADKLGWIGTGRWESCLQHGQKLKNIRKMLPRLRDEILYFDCARKIYDREIVKIVILLQKWVYVR